MKIDGEAPREPPSHEIFERAGSFFRIDRLEPERVSMHASLEAAKGV